MTSTQQRPARAGATRVERPARGSAAARRRGAAASRAPLFRGPAWLDGPMTSSHLVLGSAGLLLAIGLVMVFSASAVEAALADQPAWAPGVQQIVWACIGLVGMLLALRLPVGHLRRFSGIALLGVVLMLALVLVPGIGVQLNGARQWFDLGFAHLQPSEIAKLVFALWGAHVIAVRERWLTTASLLVPVLPVFAGLSLLLMLEPDFGAVVSLGLVLAGLLWAGGLSGRWIAAAVLVAAGLIAVLISSAGYRAARLTSFLDPFADAGDGGYQAVKGLYALATGGFWGVGLGNSRMKWNILPHAESDYIFAIIGEELGFLGCLMVIVLYGVLAYAGFRVARRSADRFVQLASTAITVWLIGQAAMNMGYVVGLLPVTGVQLPLISAGGTSLVLTLFIVGLLARFARAEPEAIEHQRAERQNGRTGAIARLLLPVPAHAVAPLPVLGRRRGPDRRGAEPAGRTVARVPDRRRPVDPGSLAVPAGGGRGAERGVQRLARRPAVPVPVDPSRRAARQTGGDRRPERPSSAPTGRQPLRVPARETPRPAVPRPGRPRTERPRRPVRDDPT